MTRHRVHNVPMVDDDGAFGGLVSLRGLAHELPTAARLSEERFDFDISFLDDKTDQNLRRLKKLGTKPIFASARERMRRGDPTPVFDLRT